MRKKKIRPLVFCSITGNCREIYNIAELPWRLWVYAFLVWASCGIRHPRGCAVYRIAGVAYQALWRCRYFPVPCFLRCRRWNLIILHWKPQGEIPFWKNQLLLVTQFPTRSVQKINCQIIRDASFVEFHKNSGQITHWKIKHLLPAQSVSPSEQGFACVNDRYHLEAEDWQARRQLKIITGHLRITEGICHCHSVC